MAEENLLVEGLDPTPLTALGASELLQLIREAKPEDYIAFVYVGETEPDIANNAHYSRFLWLVPSTGVVNYYTGAAWTTIINVASLNGSVITAATVTKAKLKPDSVADALKLLRVNTAGTAFEFVTKAALYNNGELAVIKLAPGTANQFLMTVGGVTTWATLADTDVLTALGTDKIPIAVLKSTGAAYSIPRQNAAGSAVEWKSPADLFPNNIIPVAALNSTGATPDQVLKINAAGEKVFGTVPAPSITLTPIPQMVVFYASGSWTCAAGIAKFRVRMWGAGAYGNGQGGGAGAYHEQVFTAVAGDYTVNIGAAGVVGAKDGGDTTLTDPLTDVIATAKGGDSDGSGGVASTPALYSHSIAGGQGNAVTGGASPNGGSGGWAGGGVAVAPGGGGGNGTDGAAGRVIIEY